MTKAPMSFVILRMAFGFFALMCLLGWIIPGVLVTQMMLVGLMLIALVLWGSEWVAIQMAPTAQAAYARHVHVPWAWLGAGGFAVCLLSLLWLTI